MTKKRILFQMLDNPLRQNSGNKTWNLSLLRYFKERGLIVDFITERGYVIWTDKEIKEFAEADLVENIYVLDRKPSKKNLLKYLKEHSIPKILLKKKFDLKKSPMIDYRTAYYQRSFNTILKSNHYDFILINYVMNAKLIKNNPYLGNAKTIIDTHDFFTSQYQQKPNFKLGLNFEEEITRLSLFDEVWVSSADELYLFSQFLQNKVKLIQTMLKKPEGLSIPAQERPYDIIYIASDNDNNKKSAKWFMNQVYPLLPQHIKICVIGLINNFIPDKFNIEKKRFIEDLNPIYKQAKVAICPMLGGTGIKIKVVEAFSHGLPVVCTTRGLDGLLNKTNNGCLVSDKPSEFANHIMSLLSNADLYNELSQQSMAMFDQFFNLEEAYKRLDDVFGLE